MRRVSAGTRIAIAAAWSLGCAEPRATEEGEGEASVLADPIASAQIIGVVRRDGGVRGGIAPPARPTTPTTPTRPVTPARPVPGRAPLACSPLFDQTSVPTISVTLSQSEMEALNDEFLHPRPDDDGSGLYKTWHPATVRIGNEVRRDAMIRLKGDWSWRQTVALDARPKAQFVIAFDRVDPASRLQGVARLELDMPRDDPTYLRERVGMHILRDLGVPAVCASSVRLALNGSYHGLYTAMEEVGDQTLPRLFPGASHGALWKHGTTLETTGSPSVYDRQEAWKAAGDAASMRKIIDIDQALYTWAAEIVLNNADGYYGGTHNFYTYDHPTRGFQWIPTDLDSTFDYLDWNIHPIYWWEQHDPDQTAGHHFRAMMLDSTLRAKLVDAVEQVIARWDAPAFQALVDVWSLQIADAVRDDPHRPETLERVAEATGWLRDTVQWRPEWLKPWITCERTRQGTDADGDGVPWCNDCNDENRAQRPGARETCGNGVDEDCDGLKDEGCDDAWSNGSW